MLVGDLKRIIRDLPDEYHVVACQRGDLDNMPEHFQKLVMKHVGEKAATECTYRLDMPIAEAVIDEENSEFCLDVTSQPSLYCESKVKCKKCGSSDVLVGSGDDPHHCSKCGHEWPADGTKKKVILGGGDAKAESFQQVLMKEPEVLMTIDTMKHKDRKETLDKRLDRRLGEL